MGLEKVDYTPETDEQLAQRAQTGVDYEKSEERKGLEDAFRTSSSELNERADEAERTLREDYEQLGELYAELRKQTENDALRRGLGRSSIKTGALSDLDTDRANAENASKAAYDAEMAEVGAQLDALRKEQDAALEQLDLKYAAELEERIAELKEERDATAKKYAEYNNKVAEKEQEYAVQREEDIADFWRNAKKRGWNARRRSASRRRSTAIRERSRRTIPSVMTWRSSSIPPCPPTSPRTRSPLRRI